MNSTNCTSRELYNSLLDFEQYLVDQGYLTIIDGQLTMQPKEGCTFSYQQLKGMYADKLKRDRNIANNKK